MTDQAMHHRIVALAELDAAAELGDAVARRAAKLLRDPPRCGRPANDDGPALREIARINGRAAVGIVSAQLAQATGADPASVARRLRRKGKELRTNLF